MHTFHANYTCSDDATVSYATWRRPIERRGISVFYHLNVFSDVNMRLSRCWCFIVVDNDSIEGNVYDSWRVHLINICYVTASYATWWRHRRFQSRITPWLTDCFWRERVVFEEAGGILRHILECPPASSPHEHSIKEKTRGVRQDLKGPASLRYDHISPFLAFKK